MHDSFNRHFFLAVFFRIKTKGEKNEEIIMLFNRNIKYFFNECSH